MSPLKRVILGISGGVDSAVAAAMLKHKGFDVIGLFMRNWDIKDEQGVCSADKDAEDAEWVCKKLQIPFYEANFVKEYWNEVFSYMLEEYQKGRTPNPDIYCNKYIKFNHFIKYAENKYGADAIATGHYARSSFGDYLEFYKHDEDAKLLRAFDLTKDQTFFLSQIPSLALRKTMFPLGNMTKKFTRRIAKAFSLDRISTKEDSTGICFIGKRKFSKFVEEYIEDQPGYFVDVDTREKVGTHHGFHQWTIGQRSRVAGFPWKYYICSKDISSNTIYVARGVNHPALFSSTIYLDSFSWIHHYPTELASTGQLECQFRFQHTLPLIGCVMKVCAEDLSAASTTKPNNASYTITLQRPLRALTPGQFAVLYRGEECLGSSVISDVGPSIPHLHYHKKL